MRITTMRLTVLVFAVIFAGCAMSEKYSKEVIPSTKFDPNDLSSSFPSTPNQTIVVRWPAIVSPESKLALENNYRNYVRHTTSYDTPSSSLTAFPNFLESVSTFYAGELYWALKRTHPSLNVLLEPQQVSVDKSGQIVMLPLTDPFVPADLTADIIGYTHPNAAMPLVVDVLSVSLQSSPTRSNGNCGLLAITMDTHPIPTANGVTCDLSSTGRMPMSHWLFDGNPREGANVLTKRQVALPLSQASTLAIPAFVEGDAGPFSTTMSDYVKTSSTPSLAQAEGVIINPFVQNFAYIAASGLATIEPLATPPREYSPYVAQYDDTLAAALLEGRSLSVAQTENLALIRRLMTQELQIRARRDEVFAREITAGAFGSSFRQARLQSNADYGSKMAKMWTTTAASIAAGGAMISLASTSAALLAANNATFDSFNSQMEALGLEYVDRMAPSLSSMERANLTVAEGAISVELSDQAGLRAVLKALYDRRRIKDDAG